MHDKHAGRGDDAAMARPTLLLCLLLAACGVPAVLRAPPGQASMPAPGGDLPPLPAVSELTGGPRISLPVPTAEGFTPPAAPRSGRAAMP